MDRITGACFPKIKESVAHRLVKNFFPAWVAKRRVKQNRVQIGPQSVGLLLGSFGFGHKVPAENPPYPKFRKWLVQGEETDKAPEAKIVKKV